MPKGKVKPKLKMFRSSRVNEDFLSDLGLFLNTDEGSRKKLLEFYIGCKMPLASLEDNEKADLAKQTSLPKENIEDIASLVRFLLRSLATRDITIDDVVEDLKSLEYDKENTEVLRGFLEAIVAEHPTLRQDVKKMIGANSVVDTVDSLGFATDVRAVYDDDETLIDVVPIVLARMTLEGLEEKREIVFQLTEAKLDQFCEMLVEQKTRLKEMSKRISLKRGAKE